MTALKISLKMFRTPTVRLDISSFAFVIRSVRSQFISMSVPSLMAVLTSVLVVESSSFTSLSSETRSSNCRGSVITRLRMLEYNSGIRRLHSVTISTSRRTTDARMPAAREAFSACPGFFSFIFNTGTRYLSTCFTIGFRRYASAQP